MPSPTSVSSDLDLTLVAPDGMVMPVRAKMRYDAADPFAVVVAFDSGDGEPVCWTFARELLTTGTTILVGDGDVRVWPGSDSTRTVFLGLSAPSGQALFKMPLRALTEFLARTYKAVPTGTESGRMDVDAELRALLGT